MPDRRQGDRREGGNKKLTVSLSTFVFIVLTFIIIVSSTIICIYVYKNAYNKGYSQAITDYSSSSSSYSDSSEYIDASDSMVSEGYEDIGNLQ